MSSPFVVCQNANDAAALCFALQKQQRSESKERTSHRSESKERNSNPGSNFRSRKNDACATNSQRNGKPYQRTKPTFKAANIDAPKLWNIMIIGDSIAVRMARQQQLFAPKHMKLCYGGATFQSLNSSIKECKEFTKTVFLMTGTNNALKGIPVTRDFLESMIKDLKDKGVQKIFMTNIPPMCGDTHEANISSVNSVIKSLHDQENDVHVVDIHSLFLHEEGDTVNSELFEKFHYSGRPDLVHPNKRGLQVIADYLHKIIKS